MPSRVGPGSGTVPSKIWVVLGDDPADPGVDLGGDALLAQAPRPAPGS